MLRHDPNYRRLEVRARSPLSSASYWLAADHLLVVEIAGMTERYRRFELRDIQAVVMTPARTRWLWNLVLGGLLVLALALFAMAGANQLKVGDSSGMLWVNLSCAVAAALIVLITVNSLRGPGGRLTLTTAVQTIALPGITRWRQADRLLAELGAAVRPSQHATAAGADEIAPPAEASTPTEPAVPGTSP